VIQSSDIIIWSGESVKKQECIHEAGMGAICIGQAIQHELRLHDNHSGEIWELQGSNRVMTADGVGGAVVVAEERAAGEKWCISSTAILGRDRLELSPLHKRIKTNFAVGMNSCASSFAQSRISTPQMGKCSYAKGDRVLVGAVLDADCIDSQHEEPISGNTRTGLMRLVGAWVGAEGPNTLPPYPPKLVDRCSIHRLHSSRCFEWVVRAFPFNY
jgi:hypothetical protein